MARSPILAVGMVMVLATTIALPVAAHDGIWQTRGAYWLLDPDPDGPLDLALRLETQNSLLVPDPVSGGTIAVGPLMAEHGSISFSPPAGVSVGQLEALAFDAYYEVGGCGGGSPRFTINIDTDGDGGTDLSALAFAGPGTALSGCALGTWMHHDLLTDPGPRWFVPGLGYSTGAAAIAHLEATYPGHTVRRAHLQWDSTWMFGPSVTWFDNIAVHDHTLAEPVGELWCPATVEPGHGPCPFSI